MESEYLRLTGQILLGTYFTGWILSEQVVHSLVRRSLYPVSWVSYERIWTPGRSGSSGRIRSTGLVKVRLKLDYKVWKN